jgi:hypothetical protein
MATLLARRPAIAALVTALLTAVVAPLGACNETRRSLGEECLKGDDCISTLCSSQHCVEEPPALDAASLVPEAASDAIVTAPDAQIDASDAASDATDASDGADGE